MTGTAGQAARCWSEAHAAGHHTVAMSPATSPAVHPAVHPTVQTAVAQALDAGLHGAAAPLHDAAEGEPHTGVLAGCGVALIGLVALGLLRGRRPAGVLRPGRAAA